MIFLLLAISFVQLSAATDPEPSLQTFIRQLPKTLHSDARQHRIAEHVCEQFSYQRSLEVMRKSQKQCEWSCENKENSVDVREYIAALASSRSDPNVSVWPASNYLFKNLPILDGLSFIEGFLSLQDSCTTAHDKEVLAPFERTIREAPGGEEMFKLVTANRDTVIKLNGLRGPCCAIQILLVLGCVKTGPNLFSLLVTFQTLMDQQEKDTYEKLLSFNPIHLANTFFSYECSSALDPCIASLKELCQKTLDTHNLNSINHLISPPRVIIFKNALS